LEATVASLEATGARIDDRFAGPVCVQASFSDPEGNRITVHQTVARVAR
jgi:predicted enzyme related to lactoylglutathione lyase